MRCQVCQLGSVAQQGASGWCHRDIGKFVLLHFLVPTSDSHLEVFPNFDWGNLGVLRKLWMSRARLVHVFKNWKLLFENICGNTCGWKNALKCVKCCLKTENSCLKTQTKHPLVFKKLKKLKLWPQEVCWHTFHSFLNISTILTPISTHE